MFHVFFQHQLFISRQSQDDGRIDHLGGVFPLFKRGHGFFIKYLLMGRMLVDDIKVIMKLNQPVSVKKLADQNMFISCLFCQQLFFKEI